MLPLNLPTIQNWTCHNCGGCCTQHLIEITEEERQRILDQQWTSAEGVHTDPVVSFPGKQKQKRYRLAHRPDGGCVFLTEDGLCRIHAKFGEPAKPLACRVYPYALHPQGKSIAVSLRFSCPSVVANLGKPVTDQTDDLRTIQSLIVPSGAEKFPAPALTSGERVEWSELNSFVERLDEFLTEPRTPLLVRVFRTLAWVNLVSTAKYQGLTKVQVREFLDLVAAAIRSQFTTLPEPLDPPGSLGKLYFRLFAAQYARKDTVQSLSSGFAGRWRLLQTIMRFTRGRGKTIPLQDGFLPIPFAQLEGPHGPLPSGTEELFERYWSVKVRGMHFCGPGFYGLSFSEGIPFLILMLPITLWLARWKARSQGRDQMELDDVRTALAVADHNQGYSEMLGQKSSRTRMKYLTDSGELSRLCVWYAR